MDVVQRIKRWYYRRSMRRPAECPVCGRFVDNADNFFWYEMCSEGHPPIAMYNLNWK
jgi:hypothetical protein